MTTRTLHHLDGVSKAKQLKAELLKAGIPVRRLYLYGSVARDAAHQWSDIDIAVVCPPFKDTRHEENMEVRKIRRGIDVRIEPICLHPEDFDNRFFGLAREIERTGVEV